MICDYESGLPSLVPKFLNFSSFNSLYQMSSTSTASSVFCCLPLRTQESRWASYQSNKGREKEKAEAMQRGIKEMRSLSKSIIQVLFI